MDSFIDFQHDLLRPTQLFYIHEHLLSHDILNDVLKKCMEFSISNLAITWSIRDFEDVIDRIVIDPFDKLFQSN